MTRCKHNSFHITQRLTWKSGTSGRVGQSACYLCVMLSCILCSKDNSGRTSFYQFLSKKKRPPRKSSFRPQACYAQTCHVWPHASATVTTAISHSGLLLSPTTSLPLTWDLQKQGLLQLAHTSLSFQALRCQACLEGRGATAVRWVTAHLGMGQHRATEEEGTSKEEEGESAEEEEHHPLCPKSNCPHSCNRWHATCSCGHTGEQHRTLAYLSVEAWCEAQVRQPTKG